MGSQLTTQHASASGGARNGTGLHGHVHMSPPASPESTPESWGVAGVDAPEQAALIVSSKSASARRLSVALEQAWSIRDRVVIEAILAGSFVPSLSLRSF